METPHDQGRTPGEPGQKRTKKQPRYVEVDAGYETPCWIWRLAKDGHGYGRVNVERRNRLAHRVYFEKRNGPVPDGKQLDHLCRVRACVNPDHLEPVTPAENVRRGLKAKLTQVQVIEIRASSDSQNVVARRYGVTQGHVSRIRGGQVWRCEPAETG